ncbi:MAG: ABC transporter substrate-binding protein [Chloroflexota bacterium]|nr:ABC transporter substrate-binding protein [Chloroflexota bacterium]
MYSKLDRRTFLVLTVQAAGGLALASCGPATPAAPPPTAAPAPTAAKPASTSAAAPAAAPTTAPAAPQATAGAGVKGGGTLLIADFSDQKTLDPALINTTPMRNIGRAIYDTLVDIDLNGKYVPVLAESWENTDPRTWVLHLRQGIKYPDGTPFDAAAVKFNIDRHLDPATKSRQIGELLTIDAVEIVNSSTVRFRLKSPSAGFLSPFVDRSGFMASPAAVQQWGNEAYGQHPIGVGPYRLVEHQDDQSYTVERNPDYWDRGKPYLDRVTWKIIPLDATRLVELRSGGVHIAEDLPLQNVQQIRGMSEIVLSERPGARFYFNRWNMDDDYGKSLELRQAYNWMLDREAINKVVFFGTGIIGYDPFLPGQPFYDPDYKPFTRDVAKAKALMDKADLPADRKFTIYPDTGAVGQKLAQIMQATFGELGLEVNIQNEDLAATTAREERGDWVITVSSTGRFAYRPDPAQYLGSLWHSKSTYYRTGKLKDEETDRLITEGEAEADKAKRYAIYRQLANRINEVGSTAFFENSSDFKGLSPKLRGFVHMPDVINRFKDLWLDQ